MKKIKSIILMGLSVSIVVLALLLGTKMTALAAAKSNVSKWYNYTPTFMRGTWATRLSETTTDSDEPVPENEVYTNVNFYTGKKKISVYVFSFDADKKQTGNSPEGGLKKKIMYRRIAKYTYQVKGINTKNKTQRNYYFRFKSKTKFLFNFKNNFTKKSDTLLTFYKISKKTTPTYVN